MNAIRLLLLACIGSAAWTAATIRSYAQYAVVTLKLDADQIAVGGTTTLHIYAQIAAAQRPTSERIFSWYVDLLNSNGSVADSTQDISKPAADKDTQVSSSGHLDGANRVGIYDTFLNLPAAGRGTPVELFSVPVKGVTAGAVTFHVQAGTTVSGLSADFIVAPLVGGDPLIGGDYSHASATLTVGAGGCQSRLTPTLATQAGGTRQLALSFTTCPGKTHTVEFTDDIAHPNWQALPGGPQTTGTASDPATASKRFYRIRLN